MVVPASTARTGAQRKNEALISTARAGNRRFWCVSARRAHKKAPYKTDLHRKTLRNAKGA
jgi:hypothetical protein